MTDTRRIRVLYDEASIARRNDEMAQEIAETAPADLLVLELNEDLHQHLQKRFPQVQVACADARQLVEVATPRGFGPEAPVDAVISGLGLLAMERELVTRILRSAFACLRADGRFIQFTYGPVSPVPDAVLDALGLRMRRGDFVLRNVPPATVYVYERANPAV